jgi:hypothetical protein
MTVQTIGIAHFGRNNSPPALLFGFSGFIIHILAKNNSEQTNGGQRIISIRSYAFGEVVGDWAGAARPIPPLLSLQLRKSYQYFITTFSTT